jgi:hypothetical protein
MEGQHISFDVEPDQKGKSPQGGQSGRLIG